MALGKTGLHAASKRKESTMRNDPSNTETQKRSQSCALILNAPVVYSTRAKFTRYGCCSPTNDAT